MRIGVFGGTFDPIHVGHLLLAEQCREQCNLDEVWFVPAAQPPHKQNLTISPAKARREMIEFAISGNSHFKLCDVELERSGPSYTYETLEELRAQDSTSELFLLIGADSLFDLPTWREPHRIMQSATIVAVNRGDQAVLDRQSIQDRLFPYEGFGLIFVQMPAVSFASSDLRQRVAEGRSIRYQVPRAVEAYIQHNRMYVA